jgi:hypothetical protein
MCITINKASLSKTNILSIPVENNRHFLAYINSVKNLSGKPNSMILHIPGKIKQSMAQPGRPGREILGRSAVLVEGLWGSGLRIGRSQNDR